MATLRVMISLAQIMKNISIGNPWFATVEQRNNWVERFQSEIDGIRKNRDADKARIDSGKEDWHLAWAKDNVAYLDREIRKRERWIAKLMALEY